MEENSQQQQWMEFFKQGNYIEAIPLLKEYLAFHANDIGARKNLAVCYSQTGAKEEAVSEFVKITELEPNSFQNYSNLGIAYEMNGNLYEAKSCFERALEINPGYQKAQQRLDNINKKLGITSAYGNTAEDTTEHHNPQVNNQTASIPPSNQQDRTIPASQTPYSVQNPKPYNAPSGLNFGAFMLPFFWSIAHGAWLWVVLSFFFGIIPAIILLFTGNEVAWKNREFESLQQFKDVQKKWAIAGLISLIVIIPLNVIQVNQFMRSFNRGMMMSRYHNMPQTSGSINNIVIYPGAISTGSNSYTVSDSFDSVYKFYDTYAKSSGNYSSSSSGGPDVGTADIEIMTNSGTTRVHIEATVAGKTDFTITQ